MLPPGHQTCAHIPSRRFPEIDCCSLQQDTIETLPKSDPLGIAALACAVMAWLCICCNVIPIVGLIAFILGPILAAVSVGMGLASFFRIRSNPEVYSGKGFAIVGTLLGAGYALLMIGGLILLLGLGVGVELMDSINSSF